MTKIMVIMVIIIFLSGCGGEVPEINIYSALRSPVVEFVSRDKYYNVSEGLCSAQNSETQNAIESLKSIDINFRKQKGYPELETEICVLKHMVHKSGRVGDSLLFRGGKSGFTEFQTVEGGFIRMWIVGDERRGQCLSADYPYGIVDWDNCLGKRSIH